EEFAWGGRSRRHPPRFLDGHRGVPGGIAHDDDAAGYPADRCIRMHGSRRQRCGTIGPSRRAREIRMMSIRALPAALLLCTVATGVSAATQPVAQACSPGKVLCVELTTDNDGRPSYTVMRQGRSVIAPSRLGMMFTDVPKFERNLEIAAQREGSFDQTWEQPWGEHREIRNHYSELSVTLREKTGPKRDFDVVFRLYDDGLGFRYVFRDQPGLARLNIAEELTEFSLAEDATAWWIPAFEWNREEYLYHTTPLQQVGDAQTPITLRTGDGLHVSIHEAALVDYS